MQIIYRAFDGKEFDNEADCCYHESSTSEYVMWDRSGKEVYDKTQTEKAFVLYLPEENSARAFLEMAKATGDTGCVGLDVDCRGLFLWDEWNEEYRYIGIDECKALAAALKFIKEEKGE